MHQELLDTLRELETALHRNEVRKDGTRLERMLHDDFLEFGRSGRIYRKADQLNSLADEDPVTIWAQDFAVTRIGTDAALLTYRSAHCTSFGELERHTLRSSLWRQTDSGWQLFFHQGTPTEAFKKA